MAGRRGVEFFFEHPLVHGADRIFGAAENPRAQAPGMEESILGDAPADFALDAFGAVCHLFAAFGFAPLLGAVRIAHGHAHHRDRGMDAGHRAHPGMRRPVRTITVPSISSRRIRLGEPTSPLTSGVMVAALSP